MDNAFVLAEKEQHLTEGSHPYIAHRQVALWVSLFEAMSVS